MTPPSFRFLSPLLAVAASALLSACGGGDSASVGAPPGGSPAACTLNEQRLALRSYMDENYLWYRQIPAANPLEFNTLSTYLGALTSPGVPGDDALPRDRWSGLQSTEGFRDFFEEGRSLGYGVSVAGLEVAGTTQPLRVRYVEAQSPAAGLVQRGDTILQVNGRSAGELVQANDFAWLETQTAGTVLDLVLRDTSGAERAVSLTARRYDLTPLSQSRVVRTPGGRDVGYIVLKDFIGAASAPLSTAFLGLRAAGVRELVIDLRYNGGGLVSLSRDLANLIVGPAAAGRTFTRLVYSDKQSRNNFTYAYGSTTTGLNLTRVYVLTGRRTCSASELLINGLKPVVDVVQIGGTSCGKPVGFVPLDNGCGSTVSAVNFESLNANDQGRYWDGLVPRCPVAEDWNRPLGDTAEVLLAAALGHVDTGACPSATTAQSDRLQAQSSRIREALRRGVREGDDVRGMIDR
jgi:carboxyl-terminal processing protease